ncbi:MAG: bifunctional phosphopantothenoylcysteine decarboxylase/phosphopantothenate--cysteine ligase CoaBC [Anaerolineales bacterium]|nr:bifunctional phosphopantothenoylcysteine decarboxylase/phosphopantothenate--cysteine ligase CoaBC [Anaerolineales bacterium]
MSVLTEKRIVLGVTGSIASYKAADLASKLTQLGAEVDVVLTAAAAQFITPLTFQSVTGRRAYVDADLWGNEGHVLHVRLGKEANLILVAPATANTLAKLAQGRADNLLTLAALTGTAPWVLAPAMDGDMYASPATQANLAQLAERGAHILGPQSGHLASGMTGVGRMVEPAEITAQVRYLLTRGGALAGRRVLVTAGGTQEAIDPVRAITNRSSGKQGYALAQAALDAGAEVTLVSGPTALAAPTGTNLRLVRSAEEMLAEVLEQAKDADALLMAAAVADFRPKASAAQKIKRAGGTPQIELVANPDILAAVTKTRSRKLKAIIGFAAESQDLLQNAQKKLKAKQVDMIVANDISASDAGFEVDTNQVVLVSKQGVQELPSMGKDEVARVVVERLGKFFY